MLLQIVLGLWNGFSLDKTPGNWSEWVPVPHVRQFDLGWLQFLCTWIGDQMVIAWLGSTCLTPLEKLHWLLTFGSWLNAESQPMFRGLDFEFLLVELSSKWHWIALELCKHLENVFLDFGWRFILILPLELSQLLPLGSISEHCEAFKQGVDFYYFNFPCILSDRKSFLKPSLTVGSVL